MQLDDLLKVWKKTQNALHFDITLSLISEMNMGKLTPMNLLLISGMRQE